MNDKKQFVFKLYAGADRTYAQTENPYVVFSPKFENIANSNYLESKKEYKNVALVAGEGEGAERKTTSVGEGSGLERRELFVDARDISTTTEDNVTLSDEEYKKQLNVNNRHVALKKDLQDIDSWEIEAELVIHSEWLHNFKNKYAKNI